MIYSYVDGAALEITIQEFQKEISLNGSNFDSNTLLSASHIGGHRTFFYDAYPAKKQGETNEQHSGRTAVKRKKFDRLSQINGVHVRTGTSRWSKGRGENQKAVDVMLATDALYHALTSKITMARFVVSDLDFLPVLERLRDSPVHTELHYSIGRTNKELLESADRSLPLTYRRLLEFCDQEVRDTYRPAEMGSAEITPIEREGATCYSQGSDEFYVWPDNAGNFIAYRKGRRVISKSHKLALDWLDFDWNQHTFSIA